jgi:hypothetical protein
VKLTRSGLIKKCDDTWSLLVRLVDGRCVICGATEGLQCGHLFSRVSYTTRYLPLNCWCQCRGCNVRHEFDPFPFNDWFIRRYDLETWERLHALASHHTNVKNWQLQEAGDMMLALLKEAKECRISRTRLSEASKGWMVYFSPSKPQEATSSGSN